jgi:integrase
VPREAPARDFHSREAGVEAVPSQGSPSAALRPETEYRQSLPLLSDEERERLLAETVKDPQLHTFTVLALATASRAGELWNLEWSDVDLKAGRLLLRETKNAEPRSAWVSGEALRLLAEHGKVRRPADDRVFVSVTGKQYRYDKPFFAACEAADVKNFTFHGLRHYISRPAISSLHAKTL